nr:hypothetical protein [Tanacetum cinerariifolium]
MDDDLFTYEVKIPVLPSIPCDKKERDDSDDAVIFVNKRLVRLMGVTVKQLLDLIYGDPKKVDVKVKEGVISKWTNLMLNLLNGDDEVELTNEESFDPDDEKDEVAKIFRIETDIFDFKTPICKAFNEFNYLLNIDTDLLTNDILGFKTCDEFKMNGWTNGTKEYHGFLRNHGLNMELLLIILFIFVKLYVSRMGKQNGPLMNDHECSPFTKWRSNIHETYANTNVDANYNPYLDFSRTFNNHEESNDDEVTQEEREQNNDHGIGNLDNDLVRDNVLYHAYKEVEQYKEDRCELLETPLQEPSV